MKTETLNKLCCPFDKNDLVLKVMTRDTDNNIIEGILTCNTCNRYYPIISGIPIMSPDEYREKQLEAPVIEKWKPGISAARPGSFTLQENN